MAVATGRSRVKEVTIACQAVRQLEFMFGCSFPVGRCISRWQRNWPMRKNLQLFWSDSLKIIYRVQVARLLNPPCEGNFLALSRTVLGVFFLGGYVRNDSYAAVRTSLLRLCLESLCAVLPRVHFFILFNNNNRLFYVVKLFTENFLRSCMRAVKHEICPAYVARIIGSQKKNCGANLGRSSPPAES